MLVSFNPAVSNNKFSNKAQNPAFGALNIAQITKNDHEADMFIMEIDKGHILPTKENIGDLKIALTQTAANGKKFVNFKLNKIAKEWGIID